MNNKKDRKIFNLQFLQELWLHILKVSDLKFENCKNLYTFEVPVNSELNNASLLRMSNTEE